MQQDYFEVQLCTAEGKPLPVIEYDGQRFFVGEPGQEFEVAVNITNNSGRHYEVALKVDGQGPGYNKVFWAGTKKPATFTGWLANSGMSFSHSQNIYYKRFKFGSCKPGTAATTVSNPDDIPAGQIEALFTQVVDTGLRKQQSALQAAAPGTDADKKKLPEGKKWFLAPGLKAEAGSVTASTTIWNTAVLAAVRTLPSIKVRYDSSEALFLRKALNPRFAPHRAILRQSTNPAMRALGAEPSAVTGGGNTSSTRNGAAAGVKREGVGIKRERSSRQEGEEEEEEPAVPRSATAAERVDLTEEPVRPMIVGGRRVAPDEFAVCDLCDSDGEGAAAPKWQVKKKQHVKVEL